MQQLLAVLCEGVDGHLADFVAVGPGDGSG
jgi:hypothetical protein